MKFPPALFLVISLFPLKINGSNSSLNLQYLLFYRSDKYWTDCHLYIAQLQQFPVMSMRFIYFIFHFFLSDTVIYRKSIAKSIDMFSAFCGQCLVLSLLGWTTGCISNYQRFYFFNWPEQILVCSVKMQSLALFPMYPTQSSFSGYSSWVKSVIKLHTVLSLFPHCLQ